MTEEKLTRALIESHLLSFVEIEECPVTGRFAWNLSPMAGEFQTMETRQNPDSTQVFEFIYKSREKAMNSAFGWIRRNAPGLETAAVQEAKDGIRYRAYQRA